MRAAATRFAGSNRFDAVVIYLLIGVIVVSMLLQAAFAIQGGASADWRLIAGPLASLLGPLGISPKQGEGFFYWKHVIAILGFLAYIPGSKHRHMFFAAPNIYLRSLAPKGLSPPPPAPPTSSRSGHDLRP